MLFEVRFVICEFGHRGKAEIGQGGPEKPSSGGDLTPTSTPSLLVFVWSFRPS